MLLLLKRGINFGSYSLLINADVFRSILCRIRLPERCFRGSLKCMDFFLNYRLMFIKNKALLLHSKLSHV